MKYYSASNNAFYDSEINIVLPEDSLEITDQVWRAMLVGQSDGQVIAADKDGMPSLTDHVLTDDEITAQNVAKKTELRAEADRIIAPLQDAADLDMATDSETASLKLWKQYRVALNRIDANTANVITWPEKPES
ncbi:tail fiber assembly protein [Pantoea endophytica]